MTFENCYIMAHNGISSSNSYVTVFLSSGYLVTSLSGRITRIARRALKFEESSDGEKSSTPTTTTAKSR